MQEVEQVLMQNENVQTEQNKTNIIFDIGIICKK